MDLLEPLACYLPIPLPIPHPHPPCLCLCLPSTVCHLLFHLLGSCAVSRCPAVFRSVLFSFAYCTLLTKLLPRLVCSLPLTYGLSPHPSPSYSPSHPYPPPAPTDSPPLRTLPTFNRTQITYLPTCLRGRHGRTEQERIYTLTQQCTCRSHSHKNKKMTDHLF
ncbi:hypothetical protein PLICRDRAFT_91858, partial [Plicaturopsis crispa FD-325 SS-3]